MNLYRDVSMNLNVPYHWISFQYWNNINKTLQPLTLMLKFPESFKYLAEWRDMPSYIYIKQININKIKIALHCSNINLSEHFSMKILIAQC